MIVLINTGRIALALWALYSLVLILAPSWVHHAPDQKGGIIQFVVAYSLGFALDRLLAVFRRRKATRAALAATETATAMPLDQGSAGAVTEGSGII
jgi:hypothetical protein